MSVFRAMMRWIWQRISNLWRRDREAPRLIEERRLTPEDCLLQGFTTLGNPIAPGSSGEIIISSGACLCRIPKFIQIVGYEADPADVNTMIESWAPVPVLLEDVRTEMSPPRDPAVRTPLLVSLDSGPACCLDWPAFSSVEGCRLVLTVLNVLNVELHAFGKLYVICEGGCCDHRPPNARPPPALAPYYSELEGT